ncbi:MAG: VCBS repeat-containing protein [Planctomycetota bacterium]
MNRSISRGLACAALAPLVTGTALAQTNFETYFDDSFFSTVPGTWPHNTVMPSFAGGRPMDVLLADFDGDGDLDSFVLAEGQDSYFQNGASGFADPQGIWLDRSSDVRSASFIARRGRVVDLDADGDLDIVYATSSGGMNSNGFQAIENRLNGLPGNNEVSSIFTDPAVGTPPIPGPGQGTDVEVVDWDGDGSLDLFVASTDGLFYFDGVVGAPFTWVDASAPLRAIEPVGPGTDCAALAVGDLDGDGLPELYVGRGGTTFSALEDVVIESVAGGGFADVTVDFLPAPLARATSAVTYADENGDAEIDVFLGHRARIASPMLDGADVVLLNNGMGMLDMVVEFGDSTSDTRDQAVADVDQNGEIDVMSIGDPYVLGGGPGIDTGDLRLHFQFGNAFVNVSGLAESDPNAAGTRRSAIAGGDVDLDLDVDLFIANESQTSLRYSANLYVQADSPRTTSISTGAPWTVTFTSRVPLLPSGMQFWTGFVTLAGLGPRVLPAQAGFLPPAGVTVINAPIAVGPLNSVAQVNSNGVTPGIIANIPTVLIGSTAWLQAAVAIGGTPGQPAGTQQLEFSNVISTLFQ